MLSIGWGPSPQARWPLSRRQLLLLGGVAGLGVWLPKKTQAASPGRGPGWASARSVLVVFANGGQSHLDLWDMKPQAPETVRGAFRPIATRVPGVHICEHLPRLARLAHRFQIVRSMTHEDLDHGSAVYLALTGHYHRRRSSNPPPTPEDMPTLGAVLHRLQPSGQFPYSAVYLNAPALIPENVSPGQFAGILGPAHQPLFVGDATAGAGALPGLQPQQEVPHVRLARRRRLLASVDRFRRRMEHHAQMQQLHVAYRRAFEVLDRPECVQAFDLAQEPQQVKDRYGRWRSGQACLLARRLIEAGVPLVTVMFNHTNRGQDRYPGQTDYYGWDTHNDIFQSLRTHLLPRFDQSFSALLEDLDQRGLLETTLVICMGEFGRAPRVAFEANFKGRYPGRKHWAAAYSILVAGAGTTPGAVLGRTDRLGAYVQQQPITPGDLAATVFWALGIDPRQRYQDLLGREFAAAPGRPVTALWSG